LLFLFLVLTSLLLLLQLDLSSAPVAAVAKAMAVLSVAVATGRKPLLVSGDCLAVHVSCPLPRVVSTARLTLTSSPGAAAGGARRDQAAGPAERG